MKPIISGNFKDIIDKKRGWVMGHFMESNSPFKTSDFEVKWGLHHKDDSKDSSGTNTKSKTLSVLIRGKISLKFSNEEIILDKEGDYVYWGGGISHTWLALEESLILTIRWPSIPKDQKKAVDS